MHSVSDTYTAADPNAIAEKRFSMLIGEHVLTGQPDLVLLDRAHLVDYKTTRAVPGVWRTWTCPTHNAVIREGAFAVRTKWLECPLCEERHETKAIETHGPPRPYLRHVQQVSLYRLLLWENGVEVHSAEIVYQDMREQLRVPVTLLPLADTRALLENRLALHHQPTLPDILRDPAEQWECNFCAVRAACERLHGAPIGPLADD